MDKVSFVKVERLRKLFKRERRPHCFGKTFCFVLKVNIFDKLQETGYKQAQMAFLPPKIGTNRRRGHYLCLNEEVPVDKKIPHRLNPSCRHCCNLLEPCNRKSRRVCRPEAWTYLARGFHKKVYLYFLRKSHGLPCLLVVDLLSGVHLLTRKLIDASREGSK